MIVQQLNQPRKAVSHILAETFGPPSEHSQLALVAGLIEHDVTMNTLGSSVNVLILTTSLVFGIAMPACIVSLWTMNFISRNLVSVVSVW